MLVTLFRFLSIFPLPVLHAIGSALGWLVYLCSGSYRRRLRENIGRAGFIQHQKVAVSEAGKNIMELPFIWCANPTRVLHTASIENWALVQAALDAKKGIIFLTPHLGCFEIVAQAIAAKTRLTVLYRPPRQAALKPLIEGARARDNLLLAAANLSGVRIMAKALKKGEAIGLLPDQVPQQGEGVWANFFGKSAYTMTLSAKLHAMTGSPIILTYAERLPHGRGYVVRFVPFDKELTGDAAQQASAINAAMESLIARSPSQYFWSYNRYKKPEGVAAPDQEAA
jgi:Kdo2-lipid IVA lauroyltransferase/acyltransferase